MSKWSKQKADHAPPLILNQKDFETLTRLNQEAKAAQTEGVWFRIRRGKSLSNDIQGWFVDRLDITSNGVMVSVLHGPDLRGVCENRRDREEEALGR